MEEGEPIPDILHPDESAVVQIGVSPDFMAGSQFHRMFGGTGGKMRVQFELEQKLLEELIGSNYLAATDVGRGGLVTTLAKWAIRSGVGLRVKTEDTSIEFLWGENSPRYLIQVPINILETTLERLKETNIPAEVVAEVTKDRIFIFGKEYPLNQLREIWENPVNQALEI